MNSTSSKNPRFLLKQHRAQPSKRFGQNFLVDKEIVGKIIKAAGITSKDTVLEIGPGTGELTKEIAKSASKVIAVEKDPRMVKILKESLGDAVNLKVVQGDIRRIDVRECGIKEGNYKVVGNLPFYLTAPVIRRFLESGKPPSSMTLVVQKEVGQRICQKPPRMNLLAVSVQAYAEPKIISYISKKSFWPQPEVDAALIKITPKGVPMGDTDLFFKIVKAGFSQPRKQLINNLSKKLGVDKEKVGAWLEENGIRPNQRAETLFIEDWLRLIANYHIDNNSKRW